MKKVAILQSNYVPWKGYFEIVAAVDEFILYDDVQFTKNDWRNRNRVKTPSGAQWLTIPVGSSIHRQIRDVTFTDTVWAQRHWKTLCANYQGAKAFPEIADWLAPRYLDNQHTHLSTFNRELIESICAFLEIDTKITWSWDYAMTQGKTERLISLCQQAGANVYVSGPSARNYLDETAFEAAGIGVEWVHYGPYREYPQLWGPFIHEVSILDLLFNCGRQSVQYLNCSRT
ncbi:hypothetical protein PCA31118_05315 [Pandoraea captiosa]|uniref:WbqC-like family protein n=1 Tax=Pandoraea captiosa TaxID=2508302 RepID=A0A5E5AXK2_9BURK|nr:WbqC family protein [Pandoraea captiosa]VVE76860.1 hypothetical protein PCA31118_05315 [Pandoraea captiosa]